MITFWIIITLMIAVALASVFLPLLSNAQKNNIKQEELNLKLYKDKLLALKFKFAKGDITQKELKQLTTETELALLECVDNNEKISNKNSSSALSSSGKKTALALIFIAIIGTPTASLILYSHYGASSKLAQEIYMSTHASEIKAVISKLKTRRDYIQFFKTHLKKNPHDIKAWFWLGQLYVEENNPRLAADAFHQAEKAHPNSVPLLVRYVESLFLANKNHLNTKSMALIHRIEKLSPHNLSVLNLLAADAYSKRHYKKAISYWNKILERLPATSNDRKVLLELIKKAKKHT